MISNYKYRKISARGAVSFTCLKSQVKTTKLWNMLYKQVVDLSLQLLESAVFTKEQDLICIQYADIPRLKYGIIQLQIRLSGFSVF